MKRVLIVTDTSDLHADLVSLRLASLGHSPFRLNLDEFPRAFDISLAFIRGRWGGSLTNIDRDDTIAVTDVGAVWMRRKGDFNYLSDLPVQEKAFADGEMEHMLFSLLYSLDCFWMSHPLALRGASWKGEQLQRAARMGFDVPSSIVTNSRQRLEDFRAEVGDELVFKVLSSTLLAADEVAAEDRTVSQLGTTLVTDDMDELLEALTEVPGFFQPNIAKAHELRVTVIGDRVFAARIYSQDDPRTRIDCRDMSADIRYEAASLPNDIADRCVAFVHSYGLTYGALDLIVTPDGRHVFLEVNPAGQFLFVEQLAPTLEMTDHIAACLAMPCNAAA